MKKFEPNFVRYSTLALGILFLAAMSQNLRAGEDEPRRPFAQWADLPEPGQLLFGTFYEQSEAYHVWEQGNHRMDANYRTDDENYGIDVRQGYFTFDYGITKKWAADLNLGATTVGWRPFDNGVIQKKRRVCSTRHSACVIRFSTKTNPTPRRGCRR